MEAGFVRTPLANIEDLIDARVTLQVGRYDLQQKSFVNLDAKRRRDSNKKVFYTINIVWVAMETRVPIK